MIMGTPSTTSWGSFSRPFGTVHGPYFYPGLASVLGHFQSSLRDWVSLRCSHTDSAAGVPMTRRGGHAWLALAGVSDVRDLRSGRRQGRPCRPPTPPDMRFRIRRFMKQTGSAAEFPAAKPAPYGRTRTWDRLDSCAARHHSTMGHAHWWLIATLALCLSQP